VPKWAVDPGGETDGAEVLEACRDAEPRFSPSERWRGEGSREAAGDPEAPSPVFRRNVKCFLNYVDAAG
jgi:hypothetical protein